MQKSFMLLLFGRIGIKEGIRQMNTNTKLVSIRLGHYRIGLRLHLSDHKLSGQFMFAHVADTFGITNKFKNTKKQALFLDCDHNSLTDIESELELYDKHMNIGDCYIFESSPGHYHVICPSLFYSGEITEIMMQSSIVDELYRKHWLVYGDNTIRIWPKYTEKTNKRPIKFIKYISGIHYSLVRRQVHSGLMHILIQNYQEIEINDWLSKGDLSSVNDLICKSYETVNW